MLLLFLQQLPPGDDDIAPVLTVLGDKKGQAPADQCRRFLDPVPVDLGIGAEGPNATGQLHLETTLDFLFDGAFHRDPGGKGLLQMGLARPAATTQPGSEEHLTALG